MTWPLALLWGFIVLMVFWILVMLVWLIGPWLVVGVAMLICFTVFIKVVFDD